MYLKWMVVGVTALIDMFEVDDMVVLYDGILHLSAYDEDVRIE